MQPWVIRSRCSYCCILQICIVSIIIVRGDTVPTLQGKVAVVTGSGSGIGQAIAERLAQEGANCVVDYRDHVEQAQATADKITAAGGKAILVHADVSVLSDCSNLIEQAWQQLGSCDILVNNAGVEKGADFWDVTEADYDFVLNVNLKGAFFLTQAFVRKLRDAKKPGRVINISSVHEDMVFPHFSTYCASKGAMRMLMRDLAVELGPLGITVNNIAPGAVDTPINTSLLANKPKLDALLANIPLGRLAKPEEIAGLAAFLASDDAAYVTGSTYVIDGGLMRNYHEQ
jgi:glucose 1-dehydrogenase